MAERANLPTILHVDMDAFFASVEVLDDPSLAGKPVIVGGAGARGVVASCTYEARAYGVHSAMPSVRARQLCPEAIFLSGRHSRYAEVSAELHKVLADITPMVEPIGLDEAFVDVAGAVRLLGTAAVIAHGLRRRVQEELRLECAVGIGRSKMIAKLASRAAKPRASRAGLEPGPGVYLVEPADELAFLHGHAVEALWGVGPATAKRLHDLGVRTVGDLAALPIDTLVRRLGKASGAHLAALARGEDPDPVNPNRPNKSIGHEETFSEDLIDPHELERHVLRMAESVATMLRGAASSARTITVKIKFKDLSLVSRSHTMERPIATGGAIGQVAAALLSSVDPGEGIRLLGVSASGAGGQRGGPAFVRPRRRARRGQSERHGARAVLAGRHGGGGRHPQPVREECGGLSLHGHRGRRAGAGPARVRRGGRTTDQVEGARSGHQRSQYPCRCVSARRTGGAPPGLICTSAEQRIAAPSQRTGEGGVGEPGVSSGVSLVEVVHRPVGARRADSVPAKGALLLLVEVGNDPGVEHDQGGRRRRCWWQPHEAGP